MQVVKLCKSAYKPRPHCCFEMIFANCHFYVVRNSTLKHSYVNVVFYHIESFSANKILNIVKINEIYEM